MGYAFVSTEAAEYVSEFMEEGWPPSLVLVLLGNPGWTLAQAIRYWKEHDDQAEAQANS